MPLSTRRGNCFVLVTYRALGAPATIGQAPPPATLPPNAPIGGAWQAQGPGPATDGQVENVQEQGSGVVDDQVVGAIHTVAAHPTNANVLYAGATNGGIWKTTNAQAASPAWTPLTDSEPSTSIGALEFDPTDVTGDTLVAGFGRFSSFGQAGGNLVGLLHTTDSGATWTQLNPSGVMSGAKHIRRHSPRGDHRGRLEPLFRQPGRVPERQHRRELLEHLRNRLPPGLMRGLRPRWGPKHADQNIRRGL